MPTQYGDLFIGTYGHFEQARPSTTSSSVFHISSTETNDSLGSPLRVNGITVDGDGNVYTAKGDPNATADKDPHDVVYIPDGSGLLSIMARNNNTAELWKLTLAGVKTAGWTIATDTGWDRKTQLMRLDISCDSKTVYYSDMGRTIFKYNIETGTQLDNFRQLEEDSPYVYAALKIHPTEGLVVAMTPSTGEGPRNAVCLDADRENIWTDKENTEPYKIYKRNDINGATITSYEINNQDNKVWSIGCYAHFCVFPGVARYSQSAVQLIWFTETN